MCSMDARMMSRHLGMVEYNNTVCVMLLTNVEDFWTAKLYDRRISLLLVALSRSECKAMLIQVRYKYMVGTSVESHIIRRAASCDLTRLALPGRVDTIS